MGRKKKNILHWKYRAMKQLGHTDLEASLFIYFFLAREPVVVDMSARHVGLHGKWIIAKHYSYSWFYSGNVANVPCLLFYSLRTSLSRFDVFILRLTAIWLLRFSASNMLDQQNAYNRRKFQNGVFRSESRWSSVE